MCFKINKRTVLIDKAYIATVINVKNFNNLGCYSLKLHKHLLQKCHTHTNTERVSQWPLNSPGCSQSAGLPVSKEVSETSAHRSAVRPNITSSELTFTFTQTQSCLNQAALKPRKRSKLRRPVYFSFPEFKVFYYSSQTSMIVISSD